VLNYLLILYYGQPVVPLPFVIYLCDIHLGLEEVLASGIMVGKILKGIEGIIYSVQA
jgi:hypothetical protein